MKGFGKENKLKTKNYRNRNLSKEIIINEAFKFHSKGNINEAAKYYESFIKKGFKDQRVFSNYGTILHKGGRLKDAELNIRKALELNPNYANAHCNLGNVLKDMGNFKDAELYTRKALELNPNLEMAHSNLGSLLRDLGRLEDAEISYRKALELNPNSALTHYNLGVLFRDINNLKDAELYTRKALELNPNLAEAYSNLGTIFVNSARLEDAEISYRKALELNPNLAVAYFSLSNLKQTNKSKIWLDQLFAKNFIKNKLEKDKVSIYFARANILHKKLNFKDSSKYLNSANNLKINLYLSNAESLINKSKELLIESNKKFVHKTKLRNFPECIFIVGMPRSGSTLLESILSINFDVYDLGEINIFEDSFNEWKRCKQKLSLAELYLKQLKTHKIELKSSTNKYLYNYQYAGIIAQQIPNAKIIHSYRNPLDNILSIYRANFAKGNQYSSSLIDAARVYLNQDEVMTSYKKNFRAKIYDLNYDLLVSNPKQEIKSLISWLGWNWKDHFLYPHLNNRWVATASNVQVRYPINSKSINGWKNYKEMLKPAMEIITQKEKYKNLKY